MEVKKRKGSKSIKDIPANILTLLNNGQIESANLVEWLAINQTLLLENLLKAHKRTKYLKPILSLINVLNKKTVNTLNEAIGKGLLEQVILDKDDELLKIIATHTSDTIRCWATYTIGCNPNFTLSQTLEHIKPFAADAHFGVREIAWLATRQKIAGSLKQSIALLSKWTSHSDENIRRFASEATRPCGVWCAHIKALKQEPSLALPILEPLKADAAKYVQDSVGNWLNDASKSQPQFVKTICKQWANESNSIHTAYIIKKALRTIEKQ
jgi:3-methyladenine DNA glycosylase AlkC